MGIWKKTIVTLFEGAIPAFGWRKSPQTFVYRPPVRDSNPESPK
jgi:hypothetical protein